MAYKRVLTVQDISCLGQCSLTVALPILSAAGHETCILPSAVLSTHTGGFTGFTFRDLTEDVPAITAHWEKANIRFDAIYTGYLGSMEQIGYVKDIFARLGKEDCVYVVDPAMADNGKLYSIFDEAYAKEMATLCAQADIILPNITEACFMTGVPYQEKYGDAYIHTVLDALCEAGMKTIVLTGVSFSGERTGVVVCEGESRSYYEHKRIAKGSHGTGDIYASAFVGALLRGRTTYDAAGIAAEYTLRCIENTQDDPEHWYGVKFEPVLPYYIEQLG